VQNVPKGAIRMNAEVAIRLKPLGAGASD